MLQLTRKLQNHGQLQVSHLLKGRLGAILCLCIQTTSSRLYSLERTSEPSALKAGSPPCSIASLLVHSQHCWTNDVQWEVFCSSDSGKSVYEGSGCGPIGPGRFFWKFSSTLLRHNGLPVFCIQLSALTWLPTGCSCSCQPCIQITAGYWVAARDRVSHAS